MKYEIIQEWSTGCKKIRVDGVEILCSKSGSINWMSNGWEDLDRLTKEGIIRRVWPKDLNLWTTADHVFVF